MPRGLYYGQKKYFNKEIKGEKMIEYQSDKIRTIQHDDEKSYTTFKKTWTIFQIIGVLLLFTNPTILATSTPGMIYSDQLSIDYRNITVFAPAVGQTSEGYIGIISTITVSIQSNGSGRVFVDTLPLTQIDMQGSARLSVKVATSYISKDKNCTLNPATFDFFFVIRTDSPIIGGPSAGGIMTAAVISLLENWDMDDQTIMTGMINPDGSIGPIGGIIYKIDAAHSIGATRFLIPKGQDAYTEQVYETTTTPWGQQIVSQTVTRSVSEYAMNKYGIEVREVSDINEVMENITGYRFPVISTNDSISTEQYFDSMKPLATHLLNQSNMSFKNASDTFDITSIPNNFPYYYRNQVTDYLNNAEDSLKESEEWYSKNMYYTSTSKSFQSLINSRFVSLICNYFSSDNKSAYIDNALSEALSFYENQSVQAKETEVKGAISLQCVGAAQKRASEAKSYLSMAQNNYQQGDDFNSLYQIAFAIQRTESVGWWLDLRSYFSETENMDFNDLESLANDYIQDAQQSIIYSQVILQEIGKSSSLLTEAEQMLDNARNDEVEGYFTAALFEALEALSKGNLALELVDTTTNEKILSKLERANESANVGISESRLIGIEPVLAVSYYEYAESLMQSNIEDALFYFKYSDLITGVLTLTSNSSSDQSSRYIGIPELNPKSVMFNSMKFSGYLLIFVSVGAIVGLTIGITIGYLMFKKETPEPAYYSSGKNIETTHIEEKNLPTYQESFPESIYDMYKKNK